MLGVQEPASGHAAPGGQVRGSALIAGRQLQDPTRAQTLHPPSEENNDFAAAQISGVPFVVGDEIFERQPLVGRDAVRYPFGSFGVSKTSVWTFFKTSVWTFFGKFQVHERTLQPREILSPDAVGGDIGFKGVQFLSQVLDLDVKQMADRDHRQYLAGIVDDRQMAKVALRHRLERIVGGRVF